MSRINLQNYTLIEYFKRKDNSAKYKVNAKDYAFYECMEFYTNCVIILSQRNKGLEKLFIFFIF